MQETILRAGLDVCYTWRSLEEAPLSKRPSFQFYPGDWRRDTSLQSCSLYARGLWHELLCLAHDGDPYGHLSVAGTPLTSIQIARMVGEPLEPVEAAIAELERAGVTSRSESGALYCRRMVRDERLRDVRAQAGRLGGNPILLNQTLNQTVKQMDNLTANQTPTPASASASASASSDCTTKTREKRARRKTGWPEGFLPNDTHRLLAAEAGVILDDTFAHFHDHAQANGKTFTNWDLAFNTWLRNAKKFNGGNGNGEKYDDKYTAPFLRILARDRDKDAGRAE